MIEILLKHGLDIKAMDKIQHLIPLSARTFSPIIISRLLDEGADICGKDRNGQTALHICCAYNGKVTQHYMYTSPNFQLLPLYYA